MQNGSFYSVFDFLKVKKNETETETESRHSLQPGGLRGDLLVVDDNVSPGAGKDYDRLID